jgi:predicted P-loop ATPase
VTPPRRQLNPVPEPHGVLAPVPSSSRPLSKSYASICQILRLPDLRAIVLGDGELEFNEQTLEPCVGRRPIADHDLARIRELCELNFTRADKGIQFSREAIEQAVMQVARERSFHPVANYLRSLQWDGTPRIEHLPEDILQVPTANDTPIVRAMLRRWFIAAVARALRPGCKVDTVLVFSGDQGIQKSSFFRTLVGAHWFSDSPVNLHDKDSKLLLRRVWVLEWAELESMQRARSAESVKAFITSQVDHLRPPFGRAVMEFPRTCIIVGTTNREKFLGDETGARRFWPIALTQRVRLDLLEQQRDQLWAEAVHAFLAREPWWLDAREELELVAAQDDFEQRDAWEDPIRRYMDTTTAPTMADILTRAVERPIGQVSRSDEMRAAAVLTRLGYIHRRQSIDRVQAWRWVRRAEQRPLPGTELAP